MRKLIGLFTVGITVAIASPAMAVRVIQDDTPTPALFVMELQPNTSTPIQVDGTRTRNLKANGCGLIVITPPVNSQINDFSVNQNGTAIYSNDRFNSNPSNRQTIPSCVNGQLTEARSGDFVTPEGKIVLNQVGTQFHFTPGAEYQVRINGWFGRNVQANACGFARIGQTQTRPLPSAIRIDGQVINGFYSPQSFEAGERPICSKGKLYMPVD
jgi:hypothetical protein